MPATPPPRPAGTPVRLVERRLPPDLDEALLARLVDGFYERVRGDERLGPVFDAAIPPGAWPAHLARMRAFWGSVALGAGGYDGRPVPKHVGLPGIDDALFARWLALFRATAEDLASAETAEILVEYAERIAHSLRLAVAFAEGRDTVGLERLRAG
ncbi:group III truncated hemoglobin [Prosthecomicrobium sp. N25]|uniref:group III truncated hemoglobin n=1 Tax=Prosthecomicrobium sp. N25 TaxID=3129254 RepID=UPI0030784F5D